MTNTTMTETTQNNPSSDTAPPEDGMSQTPVTATPQENAAQPSPDATLSNPSAKPTSTVTGTEPPASTPSPFEDKSSTIPAEIKPSADNNAMNADSTPATSDPEERPSSCVINLQIVDRHIWPIPNLAFRVLNISKKPVGDSRASDPANGNVKVIYSGKTDAKGKAPLIEGLQLGMRIEFQIKNDQGVYRMAAIDTVKSIESTACLKSPKDKYILNTYEHEGAPGLADQKRETRAKSHNQVADAEPDISRNPNIKPTVGETNRNDEGNAVTAIKDGLANMWGQHKNQPTAPNAGKTDLEKVQKLIEFATARVDHDYGSDTSETVIHQMQASTYQQTVKVPRLVNGKMKGYNHGVGYKGTLGQCNKYVKVALWAAGYNPPETSKHQISGTSPAKDMGPDLEKAGFANVTAQLPDARWAAPGDIIVYEKKGDPTAAGHIDIRSYEGYISDFTEAYLPVSQFKVTGIYRKYFDPLPELRMRAFLKVIREWECHGIPDEQRYYRLQKELNGSMYFTDASTHPYSNQPDAKGTFSGAYQIRYATWKEQVIKFNLPSNFTPLTQDMMAVSLLETRHALGKIRKGEIREAIIDTKIASEWSSLPSGTDVRHEMRNKSNYIYTVDDVIQRYTQFLNEITGK
jgi:muramidase (phage lysozyme)